MRAQLDVIIWLLAAILIGSYFHTFAHISTGKVIASG
jgi:hypothetical protein